MNETTGVTVTSKESTARVLIRLGMGVALFVTIGLIVWPMAAHGQGTRERSISQITVGQSFEGRLEATARTFGQGLVSHTVSGSRFTGFEMSYPDIWDTNNSGSRTCVYPKCILVAAVQLPAGALITAIELNACDRSSVSDAKMSLVQAPLGEGPPIVLATAQTSGAPGCTFISTVLPSPHTVDNLNNVYSLKYEGGDDVSVLSRVWVQGVRVFYHLQISPAPAVASFNDVPTTHPFFQFIEALLAAGITGGCGVGTYCPDSPVTRGQMAVFLSRALGLHFAP